MIQGLSITLLWIVLALHQQCLMGVRHYLEVAANAVSARENASAISNDPSHTKRLAPSVEAKLGIEFELTSTHCRGAAYGQQLMSELGWKLVADSLVSLTHKSRNVEFVFSPVSSYAMLEGSLSAVDKLLMKLHSEGAKGTTAQKICPGGLDGTGLIEGKLQATMGISLQDVPGAIQSIDDRFRDGGFASLVENLKSFFPSGGRFRPQPVAPDTLGFLTLVAYYIYWGTQTRKSRGGTAKVAFRLMARSDFCSTLALLDDDAQQQIRNILVKKSEWFLSLLSRLMPLKERIRPDHRLLAYEHLFAKGDSRKMVTTATTVSEWLQSIVDGREDGIFRKDLLSPPHPFPPHSGNLSTDWSMGALGVDKERKLVLFELRGSSDRPANLFGTQLFEAAIHELKRARQYNPAINSTGMPKIKWKPAIKYVRATASFVNSVQVILGENTFWERSKLDLVEGIISVAELPRGEKDPFVIEIKRLRSSLLSAVKSQTVQQEREKLMEMVASLQDSIWTYTLKHRFASEEEGEAAEEAEGATKKKKKKEKQQKKRSASKFRLFSFFS